VALREADVVAKLFAFAGDVTYAHYLFLLYQSVIVKFYHP
jgi:hypothetical protein